MEMYTRFAVCALLCLVFLSTVAADCKMDSPTRCDLKYPKVVDNLSFNGTCTDNDTVATLETGNWYELNFTFTPVEDAKYAYSVVEVELPLGIVIPINLGNANACQTMGLKCPLKANTSYTVSNVIYLPTFPLEHMNAVVHWALVNEPLEGGRGVTYYKDLIFCIKIPTVIEAKPSPSSLQFLSEQQVHAFKERP